MSIPYTKRLVTFVTTGTGVDSYVTAATVPTGKVWIITDAAFYNASGSGQIASVGVAVSGTEFIWAFGSAVAAFTLATREGRFALVAGENVRVFNDASGGRYTCTGYELDA